VNKNDSIERIVFSVLAVTVVGLLALRSIPSVYSPNDTGRYVSEFYWQCAQPIFDPSQPRLTWALFGAILRPVCWTGEGRLFMFVTALTVPFAFLFFGKWAGGRLLWALAALFSFAGFELATNALRQGVGIFFLILALRLILDNRKIFGVLVGVFAALTHASNIIYLPLLLWFAMPRYKKPNNASEMVLFVLLPFSVLAAALAGSAWVMWGYLKVYQAYYVEGSSPAFIIFISLPILYIYAVRKKLALPKISSNETVTAVCSGLLLAATLIFFPHIVYRVAFTSFILQIFMAMEADNSNNRQGSYVLCGLAGQLVIYFIFAERAREVLFG